MSKVVRPSVFNRFVSVVGEVLSADVMEVYRPERVAALCKDSGLRPGASLDLTNGCDSDVVEDRQNVWNIAKRDEP